MSGACAARALALLVLLGGLVGCGPDRIVRVQGYPTADVFIENPPASKKLTYVGKTAPSEDDGKAAFVLDYEIPEALYNAVLEVRVRCEGAMHRYLVYTDRDVTVNYPPEGFLIGVKKDGVKPLGEEEERSVPAAGPDQPQKQAAPEIDLGDG